jgi:hypothetical protein
MADFFAEHTVGATVLGRPLFWFRFYSGASVLPAAQVLCL